MPKYHLASQPSGVMFHVKVGTFCCSRNCVGGTEVSAGTMRRDTFLLHQTLRLGERGCGVALGVGCALDVGDLAPVDATLVVLVGEPGLGADVAARELRLDQAADLDLVAPDLRCRRGRLRLAAPVVTSTDATSAAQAATATRNMTSPHSHVPPCVSTGQWLPSGEPMRLYHVYKSLAGSGRRLLLQCRDLDARRPRVTSTVERTDAHVVAGRPRPAARRPSTARACAMANGSNEYQRMAFSWVILLTSSSGTRRPATARELLGGVRPRRVGVRVVALPARCCRCRCGRAARRRPGRR